MLWPEANHIKSNTGWAVVLVVVVDTCLNPLCSNVHITSPLHTDACPNRTTNGCRPAFFNMVWDHAWLLSLLWKSTVTNAVRPDKKRQRPLMPRPLRDGTKYDTATHKPVGYQPHCAHTPSAGAEWSCYETHLWDSFPVPLVVPPRLSAQGQGAGTSVGRRGWTGVGGAAPIHFRTVKDHHCLPSHPVTYYYQNHWLTVCEFYVCDSTKTVLDVWSWHRTCTRVLYKWVHTLSFSQTHTLHTQIHCHHYRRFSANLHIGL